MAIHPERDGTTILDGASDPEGDPLSVTRINGNPALIGMPVNLSIGGHIVVQSDGSVIFDDTNMVEPGSGATLADGVIATVSDGTNTVDIAVNLLIHAI